jgi:1-deoxy-D-xylulose-5-phosphate synthase
MTTLDSRRIGAPTIPHPPLLEQPRPDPALTDLTPPEPDPHNPSLLARVRTPSDLRSLPPDRLPELAQEIRDLMISAVCATGGHLGASLGVVELTIALHRVFDSPHDALLFDTGHQTYPHKLLTGRAPRFATLRQAGGLSGYPSRSESEHDWIENSHASTSLAYADGLARAFDQTGAKDRRVVAVIGDGALSGGLAFEALNSIGASASPVVIVVNDNTRSYDPTVGALARHLAQLRSRPHPRSHPARPADSPPSTWFEQLGLAYVGPVDGHDISALEAALRDAKALGRAVVVHAITAKGRGYAPAEADDADRMHAVGVVDPATGRPSGPGAPSWTGVFGREIAAVGAERDDVVVVTGAMRLPVGLGEFSARFPERVFDSGIAEQHAVTSAAGLAMGGLHPVVCLYATFLNRAFDQVLLDVALHRLPVTFVLDRAGITGPDGPSHHGLWDLAMLAAVPGLEIAAPRDPAQLRTLLREAVNIHDGPTALRFPKATAGPDIPAVAHVDGIDILRRAHTPDILLIAIGATATACLDAAAILAEHDIGATVVDPRWVAPVNPALLRLIARHRVAVTVEDGISANGIGALIRSQSARTAASTPTPTRTPVHTLGLPTAFLPHGERADLLARAGLTGPRLAHTAQTLLAAHPADHPAPSATTR